ncbi:TPA: IS630 family transposase [Pseudomonas putida]|jgi:transposase|nr:transposase [Stutzerimonas stutzeri B1SMN1]HDS0942530.1 IS630 family transposase [Pseudomonas putida]
MKKDGRHYDRKTKAALRILAVQRIRDGEPVKAVMESLGLCRTTFYKWCPRISDDQPIAESLAMRTGGGRPGKLSPEQKQQVFQWVNGKNPFQYGFDFGLWTRQIIRELILQKFSITLSISSVGKLLAEIGLTAQKPLERAYQRDPEAIEAWKRDVYPALAKRARAEKADIYFWDESGFRADAVHGKTWAERGNTPIVHRPGQRQSISAASAVNSKGAFWYALYEGALKADTFVELLRKLMHRRRRPLHLVVDGLPAHKGKVVKAYVKSLDGKLTLHFLPGYAPELNPDELVWSHAKRTGVARRPLQKGEKLSERVDQQMRHLASSPELIRSFFKHPDVDYISDL